MGLKHNGRKGTGIGIQGTGAQWNGGTVGLGHHGRTPTGPVVKYHSSPAAHRSLFGVWHERVMRQSYVTVTETKFQRGRGTHQASLNN